VWENQKEGAIRPRNDFEVGENRIPFRTYLIKTDR